VIDLYPAIDLRAGRCVRLTQGRFDAETVYGDDPVAVAKGYEAAGAPWVHVVDLDAARGQGSNRHLVVAIAAAVDVPVQTGGGVRDTSLLDEGVARIVAGSMAARDPEATESLLRAAGENRVAIGLDHWDGTVRTAGWEESGGISVDELVDRYAPFRPGSFVVTDISRDGMMVGPDVDGLSRLALRTDVPVVASGGVGEVDHIRALVDSGVSGVIVGRALYEGRFTVEEALAACGR
jgi:phosphoribosylformimino-5-aminoimidazole carboxamide ribotide isomerase